MHKIPGKYSIMILATKLFPQKMLTIGDNMITYLTLTPDDLSKVIACVSVTEDSRGVLIGLPNRNT